VLLAELLIGYVTDLKYVLSRQDYVRMICHICLVFYLMSKTRCVIDSPVFDRHGRLELTDPQIPVPYGAAVYFLKW